MKRVEIITNEEERKIKCFNVSDRVYNTLEELQTIGGFRRFHISQFWEIDRAKTEFIPLADWLKENIFFEFSNANELLAVIKNDLTQ